MVLDIQLPGMSGLDVARAVRANETTRTIPILAVTAFAMVSEREAALSAGGSEYMTKPIDMPRFLETVQEMIGAGA